MKADIGRVTFDPSKRFLRVVMQQGRVQLESDWNEQMAIFWQAIRTLAADLIGPWGGTPGAFAVDAIAGTKGDFSIAAGHYYVDGIMCENAPAPGQTVSYNRQPSYPLPESRRLRGQDDGSANQYLVYLDVWEQLVTAAEDETIREVALGGPDTAARTRVAWQVRAAEVDEGTMTPLTCGNMPAQWPALLGQLGLASPNRGRLRARARMAEAEIDRPCAISPSSGYRYDENALIRVEVHRPGPAGVATFKWSLDNGAITFPIESFQGTTVHCTTLGRDARLSVESGDWVEVEDDSYEVQGRAEPLFQVQSVDYTDLTVTLDRAPAPVESGQHPRLRLWDQQGTNRKPLESDGTLLITEEQPTSDIYTDLKYGVQVQFIAAAPGDTHQYRTGDYWLIPARTVIGDILWPQAEDASGKPLPQPADLPPHGVEHDYAPLAWIAVAGDGTVTVRERYMRLIRQLAECE
jgi:hypothetical protein